MSSLKTKYKASVALDIKLNDTFFQYSSVSWLSTSSTTVFSNMPAGIYECEINYMTIASPNSSIYINVIPGGYSSWRMNMQSPSSGYRTGSTQTFKQAISGTLHLSASAASTFGHVHITAVRIGDV